MDSAKQVIDSDLNYICEHLEHEFSQLAGKNLLIVGGAGLSRSLPCASGAALEFDQRRQSDISYGV